MPPRASSPVGIALLDKPPGPSSFALVAELRRRTRAKTGHTGTLDPFASGLLLLLSGMATRLAPCFVGLDKRYVTDVDLTSTTSTGDPEGEVLESHEPPAQAELESLLEGLRGEVELPIPAASAVKIGGERAYKLARRGIAVEMPLRRSPVYALDVITYTGDAVQLGLHVGSGTYVRSIATALGGHCTTLRRTAVGPFGIEEADPDRLLPVSEVLSRLPSEALDRVAYGLRAQVLAFETEVARRRAPSAAAGRRDRRVGADRHGSRRHRIWKPRSRRERRAYPRRARTPAAGGRDRHLRRGPRRPSSRGRRGARRRPVADGRDLPSAPARGPRIRGRAARRLSSAGSSCWPSSVSRTRWSLSSRTEVAGLDPEVFLNTYVLGIGAEVLCAGESFRFGKARSGDLALCERLGLETRVVPIVPGVSSTEIRRLAAAGEVRAAAPLLGRPLEVEGVVVSGDARGGTLGFPTANLRIEHSLLVPAFGIYAGAALDHRAAISIGLNPHYGGTERRIEAFLLDFTGDLYGQRVIVELWDRLRDEASFGSEAELIAQIAVDVEATRAATRP